MKTAKYIFYLAAGLMLLVNTSSDVYASGNDWFETDKHFKAYYDGFGSVEFNLLTWSEGASYNHWAYYDKTKTDSTYWTYVEYSINDTKDVKNKKWIKLFYYHGDNTENKKEKGMAWFWAADDNSKKYLFYTVPGEKELEKQLNTTRDSVQIPHAQDERRSITFNVRWAVPKSMEGKYLSLRVHVSEKKAGFGPWEHTYNLLIDEKMEEGSMPELMEPMLFMGGNNPQDAGKILVPYVVMDELLVLKTSFTPNDSLLTPPAMGSLQIMSTDAVQKNFHITVKVRKVNRDEVTLKSNSIDIPAYHTIQNFKVVSKPDTIRGANDKNMFILMNRGKKLVQWTIPNAKEKDASPLDFFEIERAYKSDYSDAEQIGMVAYAEGQGNYEYLDENSINNPYGNDSIFYRVRRASASSFGWTGHNYAANYTYIGRVKQIGMDLYDNTRPYTPYAAFRDCATDTIVNNNKIDLSGQFVWPIGDSARSIAWDPNTSIEVVLWDDQEEAKFVAINKNDLIYNVYNDELVIEFAYTAELPKTCQEYDLSVRLNTAATRFDRPQTTEVWFYPKMRTTAVNVTKVEASQGDEKNPERTRITWTADGEPTYFTVWRSNTQGTLDSIAQCDGKTNWYNDTQGEPGQPYTYMVKAVTLCSGEGIETTLAATGSRSRYGYIDGYITYTNGNKMGGIIVQLMSGNTTKDSTKTDANGYYKFSKIEYNLNGSQYEIMVSNKGQNFKPAKGGNTPIQVTLSKDNPVVHHADFLSDSYQTCSGRVLYTGTTIPVRDAYFLISGHVAMNNNDTIRSDASGNFVLSIPTGKNFTLTVAKKGHTFLNGGKLVDDKGNTELNASGSLYSVRFWDETRVRLIGRLAGGDIQGQKALGFGLSQNNLGDSLKLVLELEGDNIAHFVYDENNVDKTTRDTMFISAIDRDTILRTPVRFEEKRIIVHPDGKTGEYVIDLPPVKYRIVEASANGYATLFSAGRTSETKDLTFSLDTQYIAYGGRAAWYHDMYSVVYHSPAVVLVQQLRYGMPIGHYGEEVVNGYTLGKTRTDTVCRQDTLFKQWWYELGYPVYLSGLQYGFRLRAREEYYYNNDINRKLDTVPLGGHKFTVYNGLLSGTSIVKGQLNNEGVFDVVLDVANVTYDAIGDAALKHLDVSVNVNGQDVHADPIKAFVLGGRFTGSDAMTAMPTDKKKIGSIIAVDDVLRDPPGSHSYAWIEKGTTYNTSYTISNGFDVDLDLSITTGKKINQTTGGMAMTIAVPGAGTGSFGGTFSENMSGETYPIFSYSQDFSWNQNYNYSYTTSERIQTGNDNNIIGADATVFIGHTINAYAMHSEVVTTVDTATLSKLQPSIATGETKVISWEDNADIAVIATKDATITLDRSPVQFVYTQDHIVNQVIPQLVAEMSLLVRTGNQDSLQAIANSTQKIVYWYNPSKDSVECIIPTGLENKPFTNEVENYAKLINRWLEILTENEYREVYGTTEINRVGNFSVSGNTTVTYSESGAAGYNLAFTNEEKPKVTGAQNVKRFGDGWGDIEGLSEDMKTTILKWVDVIKKAGEKNTSHEFVLDVGPKSNKWNVVPNLNAYVSQTYNRNQSRNRTIGFTLSQAEYGYIDVDVYNLAGTVDSAMQNWRDKATNILTRDSMQTGHYDCSDFIYLLRGGATRCPWLGENKTQFYRPGIVLDPATVKLDEAHLEVDQHEVSGVAADGVAVFDLQIWNEGEAPDGVANGPHNFILKLIEGSNPNGAKVTIDGLPLTGTGRNFYLSPKQVIHKKMEVRQGALSLNYDSLKLCLISDCDTSNYANQYISVHFLPASSPVRIATPDDKWVMNTNSPYDRQGYYLPVVIDGFDPDYANFDHIELQYKLSTQSDNNWVTLCSYYSDAEEDAVYYNKASGNKQKFNRYAGRIDNIHFYGERDPMEQRYDLRAVSYCRYGTGYVSKASEPVSGIKDTRRPELFGKVAPANGVLTQQDYISVPFSEPIAYNYLDEDNNFQVVGFKNKAEYFNMPTLAFSGKSDSYAGTQTTRDLSHGDFSIDLMVYQEEKTGTVTYFSTGSAISGIEFGRKDSLLYARVGGVEVVGSNKDGAIPTGNFARVVMTYDANKDTVHLYIGTQEVGSGAAQLMAFAAAPLVFGKDIGNQNPFTGRMAEARIWSKALTSGEISSTNNTCLSGYESGLLAYYPMTEGYGKIASDKAHGANVDLYNLTWSMPEGKALKVSGAEGVQLDQGWFNNSADADYTLLFHFKGKALGGDALLFGDEKAGVDSAQVGILLTEQGNVEVVYGGKSLVADGNYADDSWHSLGLVVSRGFNYTHLYLDNKLKAHDDGHFFGKWAMGGTYLGKNFDGCFDELSIWELAMPQSYLSEFTIWAPNGQELGLRCYLPFDQRKLNSSSIYETHYSPYNAKLYFDKEKQNWYAKQDTVVTSKLDDKSTTNDVCPLIRNSEYEKMRFSWTSRDNELVVNLKMPDAEINHRSIFFSLRDVEDLQGNRLLSPIAWSVYLDRNVIRWAEQNLWVEKAVGTMDTVVYTTITNISGEAKSFFISGMPEWLTVDEPIGMLQPQEQRVLAFTISGDLNAGDYIVPVFVTDEMDLTDQILLNVRVEAVSPNWNVPKDLNLNMNLIGTVHLRDEAHGTYVDTDTRDVIGAFYGDTCVGMQTITSAVGSTANLYLKVYGKKEMKQKDISLRLWQASTGKTYVLELDPTSQSMQRIRFVPDTIYGSVKQPVQLYVSELRVQNIPVSEGWNWISFYVNPDRIKSSFTTNGGFDKGEEIKSYSAQDNASVYTSNGWSKNIKLDYRNTYMLHAKKNMMLEVFGTAFSANQAPELTFRHGWNNLPCLFEANTPLVTAMSDYFNAAKDGDIITGYYQFAVFDNKQWVGSLETLIPGEGYMLYRQAQDPVTVRFNPSTSAPVNMVSAPSRKASETYRSSTVMPIVAALESNQAGIYPDDATLRAYVRGKIVGEAKAVNGMWFLLVHAVDGNELTFTVTDDKGEEQPAANVLNYGAFTPTGTVHNPYLIRFGESDLEKVIYNDILYIRRHGKIYNAQGALVK